MLTTVFVINHTHVLPNKCFEKASRSRKLFFITTLIINRRLDLWLCAESNHSDSNHFLNTWLEDNTWLASCCPLSPIPDASHPLLLPKALLITWWFETVLVTAYIVYCPRLLASQVNLISLHQSLFLECWLLRIMQSDLAFNTATIQF